MTKIIIFGTGKCAEKLLSEINFDNVKIICFLDNNKLKHFTNYMGYKVFPPEHILECEYEYIFIASQYSLEIMQQLLDMRISYGKIIPVDFILHNRISDSVYEEKFKLITTKNEKSNKKRIAVINYNYSNYNGYALIKYIPDFIKSKYQVDLLLEDNRENLRKYDVICSSHHDGIYENDYINIEMWHGFPIKQMGAVYEGVVADKFMPYHQKRAKHIDLIMSYSQLYTTIFNACFPNTGDKYRVTGMPRNDLLFEKGSIDKLERVCNRKLNKYNIVFYLPTWRKGKNKVIETNNQWDKLFGFFDEGHAEIIKILERNNIFLVTKLHPFEFNMYKNLDIFSCERIHLLDDTTLINNKIHLYELLPSANILITDYSSIYFDTLLIDLPIIFAPTDLDEYSENRGFLLEPYDYLTPGPTVFSLNDMGKEISNYLNGKDLYKSKREKVKRLVFKYYDNKSSLRVWTEIDKYLSNLQHP